MRQLIVEKALGVDDLELVPNARLLVAYPVVLHCWENLRGSITTGMQHDISCYTPGEAMGRCWWQAARKGGAWPHPGQAGGPAGPTNTGRQEGWAAGEREGDSSRALRPPGGSLPRM